MKKSILSIGLSIVTAALLTGCGGGGSNNTPINTNSSVDNTPNDIQKGQFIDSAVANVEYESDSGLSGKTDQNGTFEYIDGDKVKFHIGQLFLGETKPKKNEPVTPKELADNNKTLILMLQLLQSLDKDHNASNGISIPEDVVESLQEKPKPIKIDELNKTEIISLDNTLKHKIDKNGDNKIDIDEHQALNHFKSSLDKIKHHENHQNTHETNNSKEFPKETDAVIDVFSYSKYNLPQNLKDAIAYMGNEERLAYDIYKNLYEVHAENGEEIEQLKNIADKSEIRHIQIIRDIVKKYKIKASELSKLDNPAVGNPTTALDLVRGKYDIKKIQDLYDFLFDKGVTSKKDALEVGCMVEVTDINDLTKNIKLAQQANAQDVIDAFISLRKGSYNHYWAFDKGLKNIGIENGCCSLKTINGVNYCQPNYPQNKHKGQEQHADNNHSSSGHMKGHEQHADDNHSSSGHMKGQEQHADDNHSSSGHSKGHEQHADDNHSKSGYMKGQEQHADDNHSSSGHMKGQEQHADNNHSSSGHSKGHEQHADDNHSKSGHMKGQEQHADDNHSSSGHMKGQEQHADNNHSSSGHMKGHE